MVGYRKILQRASFRGVKFHVDSSEVGFDYDFVFHSFPFSQHRPFAEEIGECPQTIEVKAFLVGDAAPYTLDLLRRACRKRTPGRLFHPQLGPLDAVCKSFKEAENYARLGRINVTMEFIATSREPRPDSFLGDLQKLVDKADELLAQSIAEFVETFSVVDLPAYAYASALKLVNACSQFITSDNGLGGIGDSIVLAREAVIASHEELLALVHAPERLAIFIVGAVKSFPYRGSPQAMQQALNEAVAPPPSYFAARSLHREMDNRDAFLGLVSDASAAQAAIGLAKTLEQGTVPQQEAKEMTQAIVAAIDERLQGGVDDSLFESLYDLKASLRNALAARASSLQSLRTAVFPRDLPSLVVAYEVYGDLARERELIKRNRITNPLLVPAGRELLC